MAKYNSKLLKMYNISIWKQNVRVSVLAMLQMSAKNYFIYRKMRHGNRCI